MESLRVPTLEQSEPKRQEIVAESLVVGTFGEVQSICGTHLGHNLPDEKAGRPLQNEEGVWLGRLLKRV